MILEKMMRSEDILNIMIYITIKSLKSESTEDLTAVFDKNHSIKIFTKSTVIKRFSKQEILNILIGIISKGLKEVNSKQNVNITAIFNKDHSVIFNINE